MYDDVTYGHMCIGLVRWTRDGVGQVHTSTYIYMYIHVYTCIYVSGHMCIGLVRWIMMM